MPQFKYHAKDTKGKPINGSMEAESQGSVSTRLQAMGYYPLTVEEVIVKSKSGFFKRKPRIADVAGFFRQMSDLIGSGVQLIRALEIAAEQTPNEMLREIIVEVEQDVAGGEALADSLRKHPKTFLPLHTSMIRAGEAGGLLDEVLERLANFAEQEEELRSKIWSSLAYPMVMIVAGTGAVIVLVTVVIPRIIGIFDDMGQSMPAITQLLINLITFLQNWWWALLGGVALGALGFWNLTRTEDGRLLIDRTLLKMPLISTIITKREVGKFARTLGSLLKNGVTILTALEIVTDVITNRVIRREISVIPNQITQGEGVSRSLEGSPTFPTPVISMIAVGEETGHLDKALLRIADSYERQVERSVKTLTSLIEPLIIIVMAAVVAFLVIAILLPIFSIQVA